MCVCSSACIKSSLIVTHAPTQVWRGSLLLADWALASASLLQGRTVVELGTGTGIAGIAAAAAADTVVLTDLPSALPLCQVSNVCMRCGQLLCLLPASFIVFVPSGDLGSCLHQTRVLHNGFPWPSLHEGRTSDGGLEHFGVPALQKEAVPVKWCRHNLD